MSEIRFYHLENHRLEQALPGLLGKALQNDKRIIVRGTDKDRLKQLSEYLWVHNPANFIPHGMKEDGFEADQPVFLTAEEENPNKADMLVLIDGAKTADFSAFSLICLMFDGRDETALAHARSQWKALKDQGHDMTYWQQGENGWEKKAA